MKNPNPTKITIKIISRQNLEGDLTILKKKTKLKINSKKIKIFKVTLSNHIFKFFILRLQRITSFINFNC